MGRAAARDLPLAAPAVEAGPPTGEATSALGEELVLTWTVDAAPAVDDPWRALPVLAAARTLRVEERRTRQPSGDDRWELVWTGQPAAAGAFSVGEGRLSGCGQTAPVPGRSVEVVALGRSAPEPTPFGLFRPSQVAQGATPPALVEAGGARFAVVPAGARVVRDQVPAGRPSTWTPASGEPVDVVWIPEGISRVQVFVDGARALDARLDLP